MPVLQKQPETSKRMPTTLSKLISRSSPDIRQLLPQAVYNVHEPVKLFGKSHRHIHLEIPGQGSMSWNYKKWPPPKSASANGTVYVVYLKKNTHTNSDILRLHVFNGDISLTGAESFRFKPIHVADFSERNLLYFNEPSRYLWISVDKNNSCIKIGHGYMLDSNTLVRFEPKNKSEKENVRRVLEQIEKIHLSDPWVLASSLKYWRLPVVRDPPYLIIEPEKNQLSFIDRGICMTGDQLPLEAGRLYSSIRGAHIQLSEFMIKAINYSLKTQGCVLYERVREKEMNSGMSKKGYIRVGLGPNIGDSVGEPYVLEIWPIGHESPIHSHGDAAAVIKVLHGAIEVSFYNPLVEENNDEQQPIKTVTIKKNEVTWITPEFYQTHKLRSARRDTMTATIQCYGYLGNNITHDEHFDFINERDGRMHRMRPRSDFNLDELENLVQAEYAQRPRTVTRNFAGFFCVTGVTSDI